MRIRRILPVLLTLAVAGCEETLTVEPAAEVPETRAIVDRTSAAAALAGIYDGLQDASYYGGDFYFFADLSSDNVEHAGTFNTYREVEQNALRADNGDIETVWEAMYLTIGRANDLITKLPNVTDPALTEDERNQWLGEAYLARALTYHNLVKLFGGVPIVTEPPTDLTEAAQVARATVAEVYAQIKADLDQAEALMVEDFSRRGGSISAVHAIRARVLMFESTIFPGSANWQAVEDEAQAVIDFGFELAPNFADLFTPTGSDTPEDIYRLEFTAVDFALTGFYYLRRANGGRQELRPTANLAALFTAGDERRARTIGLTSAGARFGNKWIDAVGDEDLHIIRLAEVLLIKAEAHARQNELAQAVAEYNKVRVRAGLAPHVLGVNVTTQQQVLEEIWRQRRLELAYEADRWPELVRLGLAVSVMNLANRPHQVLYPIPQAELDVAPNLVQNPGY
ncbi:MAG TPA: RagB/SusD family nutrient uptake outer membrane protein [Gemmatimonadaceae bacterium]|nr:RagB/SusD family nutrient uptake outer membrane protein [Gemmatimonadaceae bacterium]